jgi:hypothetical protein
MNHLTIQILPHELVQIIFSYYATKWQEAVRFSSVCKEWKVIADHSLIWLHVPLEFYAPQSYYNNNFIFSLLYPETQTVRHAGDLDPEKVILNSSEQRIYRANKYKIQVDRTEIIGEEGNIGIDSDNPSDNNHACDNPSTFASNVRLEFMKIMFRYHYLWERQTNRVAYFIFFQNILNSLCDENRRNYVLLVLFTLEGIAAFLFSFPRDAFSLSTAHHFGFVCVYLILFIYTIISLRRLVNSLIFNFLFPFQNNLEMPIVDYIKRNGSLFGCVIYLIGIIVTLGFLQSKLSGEDTFPVYYSILSIPLWFCSALTVFLVIVEKRIVGTIRLANMFFLPSIIFALPLMYTLITALFQDEEEFQTLSYSSISRGCLLWCMTLPLLPGEILLFCFAIQRTASSFWLWKQYLFGEDIVRESLVIGEQRNQRCFVLSRNGLRLLANGGSSIIVWLLVGIVLYLNIKIVNFTIELSQLFIATMLFVALGQLLYLVIQFDSYFL